MAYVLENKPDEILVYDTKNKKINYYYKGTLTVKGEDGYIILTSDGNEVLRAAWETSTDEISSPVTADLYTLVETVHGWITGTQLPANTSTGNTTTTALASGATFTGTGEQTDHADVMVSLKTDNSGTLYFDFSNDGTNWDSTFPVNGFDITSGIHEFHTAVKGPRWFRVRLVNDSGAQSYLRLYTYFGSFRQGSAPITQNIAKDADATIVRSVDSELDLAFGKFDGMTEDSKFGYIEALGTSVVIGTPSTWNDLWASGGLRNVPSGTFTPYMASDDAADTDIPITWTYLDSSGYEQTVTVNTNASDGRTPVSLGVTAQEVYRGTTGSTLTGDVTVCTANNFSSGVPVSPTTQLLAKILARDGQTQICAGRVPVNKKRRIKSIFSACTLLSGGAGAVLAVFEVRPNGGAWQVKRPMMFTSYSDYDRVIRGIVLEPLTDFRIRIRDVSDNNTYIEATIDFDDLEIEV